MMTATAYDKMGQRLQSAEQLCAMAAEHAALLTEKQLRAALEGLNNLPVTFGAITPSVFRTHMAMIHKVPSPIKRRRRYARLYVAMTALKNVYV